MNETLANNALTTVETIKDELGIADTDTSKDNQIIRQINAVSDFIQSKIGYNLCKGTTTEYLNGGGQYLITSNRPILSVESIYHNDSLITDYLDDLKLFKKGLIYGTSMWDNCGYIAGLTEDSVGKRLCYKVTYTYGYVLPKDATQENPRTLPYDLEDIVITLTIAKMVRNRKHYGISALRQGKISVTYNDSNLSNDDKLVIETYKNLYI